ncbi:hypothetical protein MJL33_30645, partial [Salmonella enterica subsp. enterica serovar Kentucky]|nr:hypothetical protein [Salmonella enterica subsp. enterica serovar Kentucky]
ALTEFDYLSDDRDDGIYTLSWNCIYALAKIATPYAINKLKWLCDDASSRINVSLWVICAEICPVWRIAMRGDFYKQLTNDLETAR